MIKTLLSIIMLVGSTCSYAGITTTDLENSGFSKLSEPEKANLLKHVEQQTKSDNIAPAKAVEWVDIGTKVASAVSGAAKELNIEPNQLATAPVGKVVLVLIVWKLMGGMIIHLAAGMLVLTIGVLLMWYLSRNITQTTYQYDLNKRNTFGNHPLISKIKTPLDADQLVGMVLGTAVVMTIALITIFTF